MDEAAFWTIIESFAWDRQGDDEAVIEPAVAALAERSVDEIYAFEEILAEKLHALDTEAHARNIGEEAYVSEDEFFSADGFLYARCVVVANGREFYEGVLNEPREMPQDMEFESLLSVAESAYERKTGNDFDFTPRVSYETWTNESGWRAA